MFFQGFSVWTYGGTILGYMGVNALLFPFLRGLSRLSPRCRPFLLAIGWTVYEYFKSIGFFGYPWGLVAYPVGNVLPLIQFVDITGVWGLSLLMALINALVAEYALAGRRLLFRRQGAFVVFLIACAFGYGVWRLATPIPAASTADLVLVQQNVDPWGGENGKGTEDSLDVNVNLTAEAVHSLPRRPDLAVWSESSVSSVGVNLDGTYSPPKNALVPGVQKGGVPVLFGGIVIIDMDKQAFWNAAVLASKDGAVLDNLRQDAPCAVCREHPLLRVRTRSAFLPQRCRDLEPLGDRHAVHGLQGSARRRRDDGVRSSDLLRGRILRSLPAVHLEGRRPAGEHHQ